MLGGQKAQIKVCYICTYTVICIIIDHLKMLKHFFFRNWQMTYSLPYLLYVPEKSPKK